MGLKGEQKFSRQRRKVLWGRARQTRKAGVGNELITEASKFFAPLYHHCPILTILPQHPVNPNIVIFHQTSKDKHIVIFVNITADLEATKDHTV